LAARDVPPSWVMSCSTVLIMGTILFKLLEQSQAI
jgi:hypothetical protein